jgi:phage terminase large subunit-like protein
MLGEIVKISDLRAEAKRAAEEPSSQNPFKRYKLNQWVANERAWLTDDQWDSCNHGEIDQAQLEGKICCLGMDLAKKIDTSAIVAVFPPQEGVEVFTVLPYIILPGENLAERERLEKVPWISWKQQGLIYTSEGTVTRDEDIMQIIRMLDKRFKVMDICYDRHRVPDLLPDLEDMGFCADKKNKLAERYLVECGQGYISMTPAIRCIEELVAAGKLNHGGHEPLAYQMRCVTLWEDDQTNCRFSKRKSKGKIDAIVSMAMALTRAKLHPMETGSVYSRRGATII